MKRAKHKECLKQNSNNKKESLSFFDLPTKTNMKLTEFIYLFYNNFPRAYSCMDFFL